MSRIINVMEKKAEERRYDDTCRVNLLCRVEGINTYQSVFDMLEDGLES